MPRVNYETEEGLFLFGQEEVKAVLEGIDTNEAKELIEFLESQTGDSAEMPQDKRFFSDAVLKLLDQRKGFVHCKICGKQYQSNELISSPVGTGENPLKVNVGYQESLLKRIFGRRKQLSLFGGKGYKCPEGHEVIGLVTWRT